MAAPTYYDSLADDGVRKTAAQSTKSGRSGTHTDGGPSGSREKLNYDSYGELDEPRSPTVEAAFQEAALARAQQQQQRGAHVSSQARPGEQVRPPVSRRAQAQQNGGTPSNPYGPSYPVSPPDSGSPTRSNGGGGSSDRNDRSGGRYRRHSRQPSAAETAVTGSGRHDGAESPSRGGATRQKRSSQQTQRAEDPTSAGAGISRLESPTISKSVLQPLQYKMQEYQRHMNEASTEMAHLDAELRALQERRRHVEERFLEAKDKHDDYEKQYEDVDRALRGELTGSITPRVPVTQPTPMQDHMQEPMHHSMQQQQQQQQQQQPPPPVTSMPPLSNMDTYEKRPISLNSCGTQKLRARDRIRMSLFGGQ